MARPAIASERLEVLPDGRMRYRIKRVWRDGSVAVEFDPIDFVGELAALVRVGRIKGVARERDL